MKKIKFLVLAGFSVFIASCMKDDDETLVLPKVVHAIPIDEVIPPALQTQCFDLRI